MAASPGPGPALTRRVALTGVGTVNALAAGGLTAVASALAREESGIRPLGGESTPPRLAALVDDGALASLVDPAEARRLSRICRLTVAASRLAVHDAGVGGGPGLAIVVGSERGDLRSSEEFAAGFLRRGPAGLSPMIFPNTVMNTMASVAAIAVGARAPSVTLNQPTVAGDLAMARAAALVAAGAADACVAGGVDEFCELVHRHLAGLGALSPMGGRGPEGCRPFATDHNGYVLGEGATFVVLEALDAARARGARVLAEITHVAWGNLPAAPHAARPGQADAGSPVHRLVRGARAAIRVVYGSGNGDPGVDDWERALLERELERLLLPPRSLAARFGQHGGLGALRVAAAALEAGRGEPTVLVHGIARGGCRTALLVEAAP